MECIFGSCNTMKELPTALPPEEHEGNIEYKLKLVNPSASRLEHLVTQMKWRLEEGNGEAIYELGVEDNGILVGLNNSDLKASMSALETMAERLGASLNVIREKTVDVEDDSGGDVKRVLEILVRKVPDDQEFIDLRLAVLGNVDAGKSTFLGVLTQGLLDNGRGSARLNLFRHLHEVHSGRTSSISYDILGFDTNGQVVNYAECCSMREICETSTKLITLIDLAGHHKYLKTTIFGLTCNSPDFALLMVSAATGVVGTTKEHLGYALALGVPVMVVVNKVDLCPSDRVERILCQLETMLKSPGCQKIPVRVNNDDDIITVASNFDSNRITPMFKLSCVTGENVALFQRFLYMLPPQKSHNERARLSQDLTEFQIDELYSVPHVGTVVGGVIKRGSISEGEQLLLGPSDSGHFQQVKVRTVHRNRMPCRFILAGQASSVALDLERKHLRKGMVLLSPSVEPMCCLQFEADVYVLYHRNKISRNFQMTIHTGTIRQTAVICKISKSHIKTNEKAKVIFKFKFRPEYIRLGARILFRDGKAKGVGEVTEVFPFDPLIPR